MELEVVLILVLSLVLAVLLSSYDRVLRELKRTRGEKGVLEARGRFKATEIIEEAKDRAMQIINSSQIQAGQSQKKIDEELNRIAQMQMDNYKDMVQKITISIEEDAMKEVEEFKKSLMSGVGSVQKTVIQKTEDEFAAAMNQIEEYKKARMAQADKHIISIVEEASRMVLGSVINLSDHQDLVLKALEEAKRNHVL